MSASRHRPAATRLRVRGRRALRNTQRLLLSLLLVLFTVGAIAATDKVLKRDDARWLQSMTTGLDSASVAQFERDGRKRFLREQLQADGGDAALPAPVRAQLDGYAALHTPVQELLKQQAAAQQAIKAMPDGDAKVAAKKAAQQRGDLLLNQARQAQLLRSIYAPDQLREQMVWFWLNHFSVFADKGRLHWTVADYADNAIRPHALGKFSDLVMATLESPAMLEYLDNAQNAKGKVNENYARELMELHTLGVDAGYTQKDVQQLALILTGVGIAPVDRDGPPKLPPALQGQYVRRGAFEFNPARHEPGDKTLLGQRIAGGGFDEVERAVQLIVRQSACAHFISRQLAEYFVADDPPPALVEKMARTFQRSDGDIAAVLQVMFTAPEMAAGAPHKFKDPYRFLVSALRLAYDGQTIVNPQPLLGWLNQMGEPSFGRITPDGWSLQSSAWNSSGQMAQRFEIARAIGNGNTQLFTVEGQQRGGFPQLSTPLYYHAIEPQLSDATRQALAQARSQQEWNGYLLASPDFNYR
ncbi:DUF1800 domain-containing protein [Xanthomonas sacchari]|uniref:DUF1800 domain-containing protein n=1 Tax=Xanthomonas sp. LMG 12462 TaxID=1591134 RepID=UPI001264BD93|nr:DUF1800 domain-containing protein [Xanthomonas sp. LMG 12462]KAB7764935.1 hypothetical protein CEK69_17770 [Xanthomonas sp. LMG 12462]